MKQEFHKTLGIVIILTSVFSNIPQLIKIFWNRNDKKKVGSRSLISFAFYCSINIMFIIYGLIANPIESVLVISNIIIFLQSSSIVLLQCYYQSRLRFCLC